MRQVLRRVFVCRILVAVEKRGGENAARLLSARDQNTRFGILIIQLRRGPVCPRPASRS
jgi:hypothetical protein